MLLVHGNSMAAECWAHHLERGFGDRGRAYALDLPGHGSRSMDPVTASFDAHVEAVRAATESLDSGVVVVGHSLGGHLALEMLDQPSVAAVMAIAAPPIRTPADFPDAFEPSPLFQEALDPVELERVVVQLCGRPDARVANWIRQTRPQARAELAASLGGVQLRDEAELIRSARVPVALVLCEHDASVRADFVHALDLDDYLWRRRVNVVQAASHMVMLDRPEALHRTILEFLGSLAPGS